MKLVENTGKKFGQLTVLECVVPSNGHNKGGLWSCKCSCNKLINLTGYQLHSRTSCGCLSKKAAQERGLSNRKYQQMTIRTEYAVYRRKLSVNDRLPEKEWFLIVTKPCHYCGETDNRNATDNPSYGNDKTLTPNIQKQYSVKINSLENGVSCCRACKDIKRNLTPDQFISRVRLICKNLGLE